MKTFGEFRKTLIGESYGTGGIPALSIIMNRLEAIRRQAQTSHWNITGTDFVSLHTLLDELYTFTQESIDKTAERRLALDTSSMVSIECDYSPVKTKEKLGNLEAITGILTTDDIVSLMSGLDAVSENMVQEFVIELDKFRWKFESSK